ncbi:TfpX/TfpZ family type IV pilin accessory protein [Acidovorax sp. NB1]|uniref:TfpX/TfpZ family type IV pilin accessory protein n=1 Tax=Acidovorax sp. NB1 TaxID=1943571 RepID=UPI0010F94724|nr:TfpX/TfpZ family type IV pilin accessory protein [Acidovorax sp. NB1]
MKIILKDRINAALRAFFFHVAISSLVASVAAIIVFLIWYPQPYLDMLGGSGLFLLIVGVDVACGPLLTLVIFSPKKSRRELMLDFSLVAILQIVALAYGIYTMALARPVYLAYELDRFRVISFADLENNSISQKPSSISNPSWTGPAAIAIRVAQPDDPDYLDQVSLSISGLEPVFRPDRWESYENQRDLILKKSHTIDALIKKYPESKESIELILKNIDATKEEINWLPMQSRKSTSWVVLVSKKNAAILGFLPYDGF